MHHKIIVSEDRFKYQCIVYLTASLLWKLYENVLFGIPFRFRFWKYTHAMKYEQKNKGRNIWDNKEACSFFVR